MLSSSIVGGLDGMSPGDPKGKGRQRDEETKEAAVKCLDTLLRCRRNDEQPNGVAVSAEDRSREIIKYASASSRFPMFGQAVNSLLEVSASDRQSLRLASSRVIRIILDDYIPSSRNPAVLPGVVSAATRLSLGRARSKGWESSDVVIVALDILSIVIVKSIGDIVCEEAGALRKTTTSLEDLVDLTTPIPTEREGKAENDPYAFQRTPAWLQGTSSQIHLAINSLSPLLLHPTPSVQLSISKLCTALLQHASRTLSTLQPLLLQHLLELSLSSFTSVSEPSESSLADLLASSAAASPLLHVLLQMTQETLSAIPTMILSQNDAKVERAANHLQAVCRLAQEPKLASIAIGVGRLLGPSGGIEKWGSALLGVLEVAPTTRSIHSWTAPAAFIMDKLEASQQDPHPFPTLHLKNVSTLSTLASMEGMLRALGGVAGADGIFSVEWLVDLGKSGRGAAEVSALWCAAKIFEGITTVQLPQSTLWDGGVQWKERKLSSQELARVIRTARWITKGVAELWEDDPVDRELKLSKEEEVTPDQQDSQLISFNDSLLPTEHVKGFAPLITLVDSKRSFGSTPGVAPKERRRQTVVIHTALALHILSISAGCLQSQFAPLLLHALYPVIRSLVSSHTILSETAMAALHFISDSAGYASPSNLLLSNFDYALDSISRRLLRSRLDVKATKVMVILVRLVGKDVVKRAGDVVEECFDRLDESTLR